MFSHIRLSMLVAVVCVVGLLSQAESSPLSTLPTSTESTWTTENPDTECGGVIGFLHACNLKNTLMPNQNDSINAKENTTIHTEHKRQTSDSDGTDPTTVNIVKAAYSTVEISGDALLVKDEVLTIVYDEKKSEINNEKGSGSDDVEGSTNGSSDITTQSIMKRNVDDDKDEDDGRNYEADYTEQPDSLNDEEMSRKKRCDVSNGTDNSDDDSNDDNTDGNSDDDSSDDNNIDDITKRDIVPKMIEKGDVVQTENQMVEQTTVKRVMRNVDGDDDDDEETDDDIVRREVQGRHKRCDGDYEDDDDSDVRRKRQLTEVKASSDVKNSNDSVAKRPESTDSAIKIVSRQRRDDDDDDTDEDDDDDDSDNTIEKRQVTDEGAKSKVNNEKIIEKRPLVASAPVKTNNDKKRDADDQDDDQDDSEDDDDIEDDDSEEEIDVSTTTTNENISTDLVEESSELPEDVLSVRRRRRDLGDGYIPDLEIDNFDNGGIADTDPNEDEGDVSQNTETADRKKRQTVDPNISDTKQKVVRRDVDGKKLNKRQRRGFDRMDSYQIMKRTPVLFGV